MARGLQGVMLRGLGARDHKATVIETIRVAPHFVRVRMESSTLFDDAKAEPAAWLRFWFPDPDGSNTEFQRAYTISEADVPAGRFAVDMVLHDPAGPASLWARTVERGATIAVMSLMGSARFDVPVARRLGIDPRVERNRRRRPARRADRDVPRAARQQRHRDPARAASAARSALGRSPR